MGSDHTMTRLPTPAGAGYQPEYDIAPTPWEKGREGEYKAVALIEALRTGAVEVKHDLRAQDRLFIECYCDWSDGSVHPSGIMDPDSQADTWMVILSNGMAVTLAAKPLKLIAVRIMASGKPAGYGWGILEKPPGPGDEWPTRGVALPLSELPKWMRWAELQ
jgi:hypothetical protein